MNDLQAIDHRKTLYEWDTPEFIPMRRGRVWYLVATLIFAGLMAYAVMTGSFTMALAFIVIAVIFMWIEKREPKMVKVKITDLGIFYKGIFYAYHELNAFWIIYHPPYVQALYFRIQKKKAFVLMKIELNQENPVEIRTLLMKEIPEIEGAREPMIDIFARILKLQ